jgi:hypothetical protein
MPRQLANAHAPFASGLQAETIDVPLSACACSNTTVFSRMNPRRTLFPPTAPLPPSPARSLRPSTPMSRSRSELVGSELRTSAWSQASADSESGDSCCTACANPRGLLPHPPNPPPIAPTPCHGGPMATIIQTLGNSARSPSHHRGCPMAGVRASSRHCERTWHPLRWDEGHCTRRAIREAGASTMLRKGLQRCPAHCVSAPRC